MTKIFEGLQAEIDAIQIFARVGRVEELGRGAVHVGGLSGEVVLGDRVQIRTRSESIGGEVVRITRDQITVLPDTSPEGAAKGPSTSSGTRESPFSSTPTRKCSEIVPVCAISASA